MAEAVDSDYYAQFGSIVEPGQDLELEPLNAFYLHAPDDTSTFIENVFDNHGSHSSHKALTSQYSYPPPPVAYNYRPHPYPDPSIQTMERLAAFYAPSNPNPDTVWTRDFLSTDNPTIAPNQIILQRGQEAGFTQPCTRDDYMAQDRVETSVQPTTQSQHQTITSYQNSLYTQPPRAPQRTIQPATNFLRDGSTPYVPGRTARRKRELQHLTDAMTAVVERQDFECDECGKTCKTKAGLNHHKVTHDREKMSRHKCHVCDSAFRYPKDLERHNDAKHRKARHACADCHRVYGRRDHLDRHTKRKGHVAASTTTSLIPASPMSPSPSTNAYDKSSIVGASPSDDHLPSRSYDYAAQIPSLSQQSLSHLDPSLLQAPPFSSASFTTGSIDDTFTVSSEVDSFWSDRP